MSNKIDNYYRKTFGSFQPLSDLELNDLLAYIPELLGMPFVYFPKEDYQLSTMEFLISGNDLKTILFKTIHETAN